MASLTAFYRFTILILLCTLHAVHGAPVVSVVGHEEYTGFFGTVFFTGRTPLGKIGAVENVA